MGATHSVMRPLWHRRVRPTFLRERPWCAIFRSRRAVSKWWRSTASTQAQQTRRHLSARDRAGTVSEATAPAAATDMAGVIAMAAATDMAEVTGSEATTG